MIGIPFFQPRRSTHGRRGVCVGGGSLSSSVTFAMLSRVPVVSVGFDHRLHGKLLPRKVTSKQKLRWALFLFLFIFICALFQFHTLLQYGTVWLSRQKSFFS